MLQRFLTFFTDGHFGAYMQVSIQNDGPVTIQLESPLVIFIRSHLKNDITLRISFLLCSFQNRQTDNSKPNSQATNENS